MILILNLILLVALGFIAYEDIRDKQVTLILLIGVLMVGGVIHYLNQDSYMFFVSMLINTVVILSIILMLFLYSKLKMRVSLDKALGTGDILFFLFLGVTFPTTTFLILFIASILFSFIVSILIKTTSNQIPLAGYQAIFIMFSITSSLLIKPINLYLV